MRSDGPAHISRAGLLMHLENALELLSEHGADAPLDTAPALPLPSLLAQCEELTGRDSVPPVRLVHHFACTGGTLLSRVIAVLPNTTLLSELDPLSRMEIHREALRFAPTDILRALHGSARPIRDTVLEETFLGAIDALHAQLAEEGGRLVLRVHSHSQFCTRIDFETRPTVLEIVQRRLPVRPLITVRHPLDSFLSTTVQGWRYFSPFTLEEYARRYTAFLDRHEGAPVVLYEDFVANPEAALQQICAHLDLPYSPLALNMLGAVRLTGASGRSSDIIGPRPRRPVPPEIEAQRGESPTYAALCERFGYEV